MSYSKINVNTLTGVAVTNSDTVNIPIVASEGFLIYVGSSTSILQDITPGAGTADPRYVNIRVKTISGNSITFENFPVGNYLPIQIVQLYSTSTTAAARNTCVAIW